MMGLCWTQKTAQPGLSLLASFYFPPFSATLSFCISYLWLFPISGELVDPHQFCLSHIWNSISRNWNTELLLTTDAASTKNSFSSFCFILPLLFIFQGLFCFVLLCLSPFLPGILLILPSKLFFSSLFLHLYFLVPTTYVPFLPWGTSVPLSSCILPSLLASFPSAIRCLMQQYSHLTAALPANPERTWPTPTHTDVKKS